MMPLKNLAVCCGADESVTFSPKPKLPATVGVPVIDPVEEFKDKPGGRLPEEMLHVYGASPPETEAIASYAIPTAASGSDVIEKESCGFTTRENGMPPVRAGTEESAACTVKFEVPLAVGTPETKPVLALRLKLAGSAPAITDQV